MISFEDARRTILDAIVPLPAESARPLDAVNRFAAADVAAPEDLPRFAISAMDGYALPADVLAAVDADGQARATCVGEIAAGAPGVAAAGPGEVARIFTGGAVPPWAAAVVMQEQCRRDGDAVVLAGPVRAGQYIRPAGGDVRAGGIVLRAGAPILPPDVALLTALGVPRVSIGRRPSLGLLVTGSELTDDPAPGPGQIRDSNGPMLEAAARACGAGLIVRMRAGDSLSETLGAIRSLLDCTDLLVVSGGVSVGDHDHVKEAFAAAGVEQRFWQVAQRPGKPFWFGMRNATPVFGLPGNPASALATFLALVWPALRKLQFAQPAVVARRARLSAPATKARGLTALLRGRTVGDGPERQVDPSGGQDSHLLSSFARSDCLVVCPPDSEVLPTGTEVEVLPYPWGDAPLP